MSISNTEAVRYVARAITDGLIVHGRNGRGDLSVGDYHAAVSPRDAFAVFYDGAALRRYAGTDRTISLDAHGAAAVFVGYVGRGDARKAVVRAYENADRRVPAVEPDAPKRARRRR